MNKNIKIIAFDADDTLWQNENFYRDTENEFADNLRKLGIKENVQEELLKTEHQNISLFGYGCKGFTLSMIETAVRLCKDKLNYSEVEKIINLGKKLIKVDLILLPEVEETLKYLQPNYKLILATKGDLLDQERKLANSGLEKYFHHIEIMSDKKTANYQKLLNHLDVKPEEFLMIGNSLRSDVLPLIELGANAIHIPYHTTWEHEKAENVEHDYLELKSIGELRKYF